MKCVSFLFFLFLLLFLLFFFLRLFLLFSYWFINESKQVHPRCCCRGIGSIGECRIVHGGGVGGAPILGAEAGGGAARLRRNGGPSRPLPPPSNPRSPSSLPPASWR